MSKEEGLKHKYDVSRVDGKAVTLGCVVLEFADELSWPALLCWAATMEAQGYYQLARDVRQGVEAGRRAQVRTAAFNRRGDADADP